MFSINFKSVYGCVRCSSLWMSMSMYVCSNDCYLDEGWPGCSSNIDHLNIEFYLI